MSKVDTKKQLATERIANHLLAVGLNKTGLRLLAEVAGTSDRMLIYYFGSKDALLDEVLGGIAANFTEQMDATLGTHRRSADQLLAQLTAMTTDAAYAPAVRLWFELVGLAAREQEPYLSNARLFADQWIEWIASRLAEGETQTPDDLYAQLEGRIMLTLIRGNFGRK